MAGNCKLPVPGNKEFICSFSSISARADKLKIAVGRGELAKDALTFIDLISDTNACIRIKVETKEKNINFQKADIFYQLRRNATSNSPK